MSLTTDDTTTKDDVALLADTARNFGKMVTAIDRLATVVVDIPESVVVHVQYDDRIARALENIADTLARLERQ